MRLPVWTLALLTGCALEPAVRVEPCGPPTPAPPVAAQAPPDDGADARDFAAAVLGPARCADAAARSLPTDADEAWRRLRACVDAGRFTALQSLLSGAWDHELQTRRDAPELVTRIIAMRGGAVDDDLRLLHERRIPLFSLAQALAQPDLYRGALVILRARVSPSGLLDELRLASSVTEVELGPAQRLATRQPGGPWESTAARVRRRAFNVEVSSGRRALVANLPLPFVDPDDGVVLLARFEGLRDGDGWPTLSVLAHHHPNALVSY
jgi:hypothetical protein